MRLAVNLAVKPVRPVGPSLPTALLTCTLRVELLGRYSKMNSQVVRLRELLAPGHDQHVSTPRQPKQLQTRLSPDRRMAFADSYRAGMSIPDLAAEFRINRATVFRLVERLGLPRRTPILRAAEVEEARRLYQSGYSLARVGEHLGVAAHTVTLALRKAGVEIRKRRGYE